jgi:hypothetical protein
VLKVTFQEYGGELLFEVNAQGEPKDARAILDRAIGMIEESICVTAEQEGPTCGEAIIGVVREEIRRCVARALKAAGEAV